MKTVSIFGLGYVGSVAAGCLAARGCRVVGVDVHPEKVRRLNAGEPPIFEPGLEELIADGVEKGRIEATTDVVAAVEASDISLICVGTPCGEDGELDLTFVETVTREIAGADPKEDHWIVYRSTMLPGAVRGLIEAFQSVAGEKGRFAFFPEFLRQGSAIADYNDPSLSVIGVPGDLDPFEDLSVLLEPDTRVVALEEAELLKYACNAFHATKVAFANEIGRLSKKIGIDAPTVMESLCDDERLNISRYYMRPGNPFGGSCLPKDVSALTVGARGWGADVPLLDSLLHSNDRHRDHLVDLIEQRGEKEVVILGLAFKPETDDLRGSALVRIAAELLGGGFTVRVFEPLLDIDSLVGAARQLVDEMLPALPDILYRDLREALGAKGTVLASNQCASLEALGSAVTDQHHIIDVTGWRDLETLPSTYEGICW